MKRTTLVTIAACLAAVEAYGGLFDFLGLGKSKTSNQPASAASASVPLSNDQVVQGLKEALGAGVQRAVSQLGREGGFTTNLNVRIPMPENLRTVERTLRTLKQDKLADEFVLTMNRAAEKAVPAAAETFSAAVKSMTIEDARGVLMGTNDAATQYFRRTTETNLYEKFLPIVKQTTESAGVTAAYKQVVGATSSRLGAFSQLLGTGDAADVDAYVTHKTLDGLFKVVADEEKLIRANPAARTSQLLEKVFGAAKSATVPR
jgi:hypothetical protein